MDVSFPKKEHLCLKKRFDELLKHGKSFFIYPFRVIYFLKDTDNDYIPMQVAISVKKKQFRHAVERNLIKRRFRESWRIHKSELHTCLASKNRTIYVLMVYGANEILSFNEINLRIPQIMQRLSDVVTVGYLQ